MKPTRINQRLRRILAHGTLAGVTVASLAACAESTDAADTTAAQAAVDTSSGDTATEAVGAATTSTDDAAATGDTAADSTGADDTGTNTLDADWSAADEQAITLADGASSSDSSNVSIDGDVVTITASGTYRVSGSLSNGQLVVDAADDGLVRVIFDNTSITSSTPGAFYVAAAGDVELWLDGDNSLTDGGAVTTDESGEEGPNAALYSKADLVIGGDGTLNVTGNVVDGITGKDDLTIAGGTITVTAADDGIRGKDSLTIDGGTISVDVGGDGLSSDNEESTEVGNIIINDGVLNLQADTDAIDAVNNVSIEGGSLAIAAGDDAIHADTTLAISGGTIDISESYEGLEGRIITISDGAISIVASDDGFNVAGGNDGSGQSGPGGQDSFAASSDQYGEITGGTIIIDAEGDGLDANGSLTVSGGTVIVNGPTGSGNGAIDVDSSFDLTSTVFVATGSAGMAQSPTSGDPVIAVRFGGAIEAGTVIEVTDASGNLVAAFETAKATETLIVSTPEVTSGATYTISVGGTIEGTTVGGLLTNGEVSGGESLGEVST